MPIELDHFFICTDAGAPAADRLVQLGFREGAPNQHPGQGTANRRFFFSNAMLELLWVSDASEAQSSNTRRTQLWERWSGREDNASPFGICLRPADSRNSQPPFPAWEYHPAYLPDPMCMHIAEADITEPMWVYLGFLQGNRYLQNFTAHPNGAREITGITLATPTPLRSPASRVIVENAILTARPAAQALLEIEFDAGRQKQFMDLRPDLPATLRL